MPSNIDEARALVPTLLNDLETVAVRTEGILMKAKRLARLMRDGDAQQWLEYEMTGYPKEGFDAASLGTCARYGSSQGESIPKGNITLVASLSLRLSPKVRKPDLTHSPNLWISPSL